MLGAIIGGAMKIGGAVAGGIMGAKSARKQARMIADEKVRTRLGLTEGITKIVLSVQRHKLP